MELYTKGGEFKHFIGEIPVDWTIATPEQIEQRESAKEQEKINNLTITQRQLRLYLLREKALTEENIINLLQGNSEAIIEFNYASVFLRSNPMFNAVGALLSMTPQEINTMFVEAKKL